MSKLSEETRRAVLNQSIMNEARARSRLKRINETIEYWHYNGTLEDVIINVNNVICDMIKDIETDIDVHKWELKQMNKEVE